MNKHTNEFAKQTAEHLLYHHIWKIIKKDWWEPFHKERVFIDDEETILLLDFGNTNVVLGYFHFYHDAHLNQLFGALLPMGPGFFTGIPTHLDR